MILEDISGKIAIITGSSSGIGKAASISLLEQGAKVIGFDYKVGSIQNKNYIHHLCNLASVDEIENTFIDINKTFNSIDYLVNVAGIDPKVRIEESDKNNWDKIVNLNLRGYYFCIRYSLEMLKKGYGKSIVNISSINYKLGIPGRSIYSSTKAGIIGLTSGLARELGNYNIRINCISPGWIFTDRQKEEYFNTANEEKNSRHLESLYSNQSLKIKIQPEDIANHILFLLSSASRATTGHNLIVDGGWLLE